MNATVVIGVRNRAGLRLENCLRSLAWQEAPVRVLLVDYGSAPDSARSLEELASKFGAELLAVDASGPWNRSRALNIGLRAVTTELVLFSDADMIFAPDFTAQAVRAYNLHPGESMVVCRCRDLAEGVADDLVELEEFDGLQRGSTFRWANGTGACQLSSVDFFRRVRGYDEGYEVWGSEDEDMLRRARADGSLVLWIHERTSMLHQWHAPTKNSDPWQKKRNKLRLLLTSHRIVKNGASWGRAR